MGARDFSEHNCPSTLQTRVLRKAQQVNVSADSVASLRVLVDDKLVGLHWHWIPRWLWALGKGLEGPWKALKAYEDVRPPFCLSFSVGIMCFEFPVLPFFSLRSCRSSSVNFFDFSPGNLENLVGNLEGIFRGFFLTHRTKAQNIRGKFRSIFRKKIRDSTKKSFVQNSLCRHATSILSCFFFPIPYFFFSFLQGFFPCFFRVFSLLLPGIFGIRLGYNPCFWCEISLPFSKKARKERTGLVLQRAPNTPEFAQPRLSRSKGWSSPASG